MSVELHIGKPETSENNIYFWLEKNNYGNITLFSQREGQKVCNELTIYVDLTIDPVTNTPHNCKVTR